MNKHSKDRIYEGRALVKGETRVPIASESGAEADQEVGRVGEMGFRTSPRSSRNGGVNGFCKANGEGLVHNGSRPASSAQKTVNGFKSAPESFWACETCLSEMKPGSRGERKRFCSARCRGLAWSLTELEAALNAGRAEGLRGQIRRLGRAA